MYRVRKLVALSWLLLALSAKAETPAFDPRAWKSTMAGQPTQVLTIGSPHLSQMPVKVTPALIAPLVDKLAAFKPDVITVENLSGLQCDVLLQYKTTFPDMFDSYCRGTDEAAKATGLSVAQALPRIETTLASWPRQPAPAQRRALAALFLAANDRPSAQVQWLRLPVSERREGDGIDAALLKILAREGAKANETYEVAVALAVRLGLERIYLVDDHTADSIQAQAGPGLEAAIGKIWSGPPAPEVQEARRRETTIADGAAMLDYYRFMNRPTTQRAFVTADMGAAMRQVTPELYGRQYLAWYEVRNLRMVANIRAAFGNRPGARVLNIVGASHKGYYDAYLDMMSDVKLVDAEAVLR